MSEEEKQLFSTVEAAEFKGVHVQTLKGWYMSGRLKGEKRGHSLIFHRADLVAFVPPAETRGQTEDGQDKHVLAAKMYDNEKKSLKEIAEALGYANESGASRAVKFGREKLAKSNR